MEARNASPGGNRAAQAAKSEWSREDDLSLAIRLAKMASGITLSYFGKPIESHLKADGSPVGEADLAAEAALLETLARERPGDAILSEERGQVGSAKRRWLLDPLDGTAMFLAGASGWGTLIALEYEGETVVGVITRPQEERCWWAVRGAGAFTGALTGGTTGARKLAVSQVASVSKARLTAWQPTPSPEVTVLRSMPGWMDPNPNVFLRLMEGELDAVVSLGGLVWDHAPTVLILEESGGMFRDRAGGRRLDLRGGVYGNGHLTTPVGELIGWYR